MKAHVFVGLAFVAACAHPRPVAPPPPPRAEVRAADGLGFAIVPLETEGLVRVAAYIDVGARDSQTPGAATVTALVVADAFGEAARPLVTIDTTELAAVVEARDLGRTLDTLARALSLRDPSHEGLERALDALRSRRAVATRDPLRGAELRALEALTGLDAGALDPLGSPDDSLPDGDDVKTLLASRYVRERVRIVVTGDVDEVDAERAIRAIAARFPTGAEASRSAETRPPRGGSSAELGSREVATLAVALPNEPRGTRFVERLREVLGPADHGRRTITGLPTRDGFFVVAQGADVEEPFAELERFATAAALVEAEARTAAVAPPDAILAARELGLGLGPGAAPAEPIHAAHVITRGSRSTPSRSRASDQNEDELDRRTAEALTRGLAEARPDVRGTIDEMHADVTVGRGAILRVHRSPRARALGLVVRFHAPDVLDAGTAGGTTAVLAHAVARACVPASLAPEPFVDAEGFGISIRGEPAVVLESVGTLLPCVLARELGETAFDEALRDALAALRSEPFGDDAAGLASAIAPSLAATLAPLGSRRTVGNLDTTTLRLALRAARTAEHVRVAVIGDAEPARLVARVAPYLGGLPAGEGVETPARVELPDLVAAHVEAPFPLVLVVARATPGVPSPRLGRALGTRLVDALSGVGADVLASGGDARGEDALGFVLARVDEATLERVPEAVTRALVVDRELERSLALVVRAERLRAADPRESARMLARLGERPRDPLESRLGPIETTLVVGRDQPLAGAAIGRTTEAPEDEDATR